MADRLLCVFDALPTDAQQLFVRTQLTSLLDAVPVDKQRSVIASAVELQRRYAHMPALNLDAKKQEIAALIFELSRDAKRSIIQERSRRDELLSEAADTLAQWLNDIWKVVFEFRTNFSLAHTCLLFACDALEQIGNGCGGCKCAFATMFIPVNIKRSSGKVVKSFTLNGIHNLENVVLWIWRDLFMILLATGPRHQRSAVPAMIDEIRILLGWGALEKLLRGGTKSVFEGDSEDEPERTSHEAEIARRINIIDDDDDPNYVSDECSSLCDEHLRPRCFYASHWSWRITDQQTRLCDLVHTALLNIFKVAPSGPLYSSILAIADDEFDMEEELHELLLDVAGNSCENLGAALRILSLKNRPDQVYELVETHKHLLRPQDAPSLQLAVLILSSDPFYSSSAMAIAEEELLDVVKQFHGALRLNFCNMDSGTHKAELAQILALRRDAPNRRIRIERWVKGALTPQPEFTHPMAIAAIMMGIPLPPGTEGPGDGDMLGYVELEGDDPEVDALRHEFRPNIKARFQGWVDTAVAIKGGPTMLNKVYAQVVVDMPVLKEKDVVEEMAIRIADRPSKMHVSDALDAFKDFCEKQGQKLAMAKFKGKGKGKSKSKAARTGAGLSRADSNTSTSTSAGTSINGPSCVCVFGMGTPLDGTDPDVVFGSAPVREA